MQLEVHNSLHVVTFMKSVYIHRKNKQTPHRKYLFQFIYIYCDESDMSCSSTCSFLTVPEDSCTLGKQ